MIKRITIFNPNGSTQTLDLGEHWVFAFGQDLGKTDIITSFEVISVDAIAIRCNGMREVICGMPFRTIEVEDKKDE